MNGEMTRWVGNRWISKWVRRWMSEWMGMRRMDV